MDISLTMTRNCNLRCSYCYAGEKLNITISRHTIDKTLEFILKEENKHIQLGFFGGEPLLEFSLIQYATEIFEKACREKKITLVKIITTNGTLINHEIAKWLADKDFHLAVSIDGNKKMHDQIRRFADGSSSWKDALRGFELIRERVNDLEIITVVSPANVDYLAKGVIWLFENSGVKQVSINPDFYSNWTDDQLFQLKKEYEKLGIYYLNSFRNNNYLDLNIFENKIITHLKNGYEECDKCGFGLDEFAVSPEGDIFPCERLVGKNDKKMCIGNVFQGFNLRKRNEILTRKGKLIVTECSNCVSRDRCVNWCHCINYGITGNMNKVNGTLCFHEKTIIEISDQIGEILFKEKNPLFISHFYLE
ncbi:MAG: radical SAM protein [Myxococcota bacterium]